MAAAAFLTLPVGWAPLRLEIASRWLDLLVLPAIMMCLGHGLSKVGSAERLFWLLWLSAIACWLAVRVVLAWRPGASSIPGVANSFDVLYLAFYLLLFIAAALAPRPPSNSGWAAAALRKRQLLLAGLALGLVTAIGFVRYILASMIDDSAWSSYSFYVVLDLLLCGSYALLAFRPGCGSIQRGLYGLLAATCALWAAVDLLEGMVFVGWMKTPTATWFDLLWYLPLLTLVAAAQFRHLTPQREASDAHRASPPESLVRRKVIRNGADRRHLRKQLRQAHGDLRRAHGIAHELNDQVTVMLGRSELLVRSDATLSEANLEEIHRAAKLAATMAHELLDCWATHGAAPSVAEPWAEPPTKSGVCSDSHASLASTP